MGNLAASVVDLSVKRGNALRNNEVIKDLSFDIAQGEIVSLVGASGRGKTTLLHALAGLIPTSSGSINIQNSDARKQSGLVFQEPLLLPWLSVKQNIRLGFKFKANRLVDKHEIDQRVADLLRVLGIDELTDRKISELSGGQAQRVAIARTIATEPKLLLLDEPFSALDVATRAQLQNWLLDLRKKLQLTIVLVTHDLDEALLIADRVLVLPNPGEALRIFNSKDKTQLSALKREIVSAIVAYEI